MSWFDEEDVKVLLIGAVVIGISVIAALLMGN